MTRLSWGDTSQRRYETGVDRGVFYPKNTGGQAWNGLVSVEESPSESVTPRYLDGIKLRDRRSVGSFEATVEAYTFPQAFEDYLGLYQGFTSRKRQSIFDFSYRVMTDDGYKIHLVYNATANPSSKSYKFDSVDTFSWVFTTKPMYIEDATPSAHLIVDAGSAYSTTIAQLENVLYGSDSDDARMPSPEEVVAIFDANSILKVTDLGNGVIEVDGPDSAVVMINSTTVEIDWPSVTRVDHEHWTIYSY